MYVSAQGSSVPSGRVEFEKLLRESQKEVLWLQRQLSVTSAVTQQQNNNPGAGRQEGSDQTAKCDAREGKVKPASSYPTFKQDTQAPVTLHLTNKTTEPQRVD